MPLGDAAGAAVAHPPSVETSTVSVTNLPLESAARLQQLAADLALQIDPIIAVVNDRALAAVPQLVDSDDPTSGEALLHSTQANIGAILTMLAHGIPGEAIQPPKGALELFERLAERDDGLVHILRAYRVGMAELWQLWARYVLDNTEDSDEFYELLAASTSFLMTYISRMSDELIALWSETRRRREQGLDVAPEDIIRKALFSGSPDGHALERLGYDVDRVQMAFALSPAVEEEHLRQIARRVRATARAQTLTIHRDAGWVIWVAVERAPDDHLTATIEQLIATGDCVGASENRIGIAGFRAVHREAMDARRVALLRGDSGLTRYRDVALLAVLTADTDRAKALARSELGPLADDTESMARLRETVRAYLACGESHVATATRLFVHEKTVAYRIRQAEELLGRRIRDRHAELEAALLVYAAFRGDA